MKKSTLNKLSKGALRILANKHADMAIEYNEKCKYLLSIMNELEIGSVEYLELWDEYIAYGDLQKHEWKMYEITWATYTEK